MENGSDSGDGLLRYARETVLVAGPRFRSEPRGRLGSAPLMPTRGHDAQLPIEPLTELNVPLTLPPRLVTTVMQATRISASITAYSTAVGPLSSDRNCINLDLRRKVMVNPFLASVLA